MKNRSKSSEPRRHYAGPLPSVRPDGHHLLIGPANSAGQGAAWASSVNDFVDHFTALNYTMVTDQTYDFASSYSVPATTYVESVKWQQDHFKYVVENFEKLLWESGRPPHGLADGTSAIAQIESLARTGVDVAFVGHGSDIRVPSVHAMEGAWSPFRNVRHELTVALERKTKALHESLADFSGPRFVSTPDLIEYLPDSIWLPVVLPRNWLQSPERSAPTSPLKVGHATSNSMLKRSDDIELLLEPLVADGTIEYTRISGLPPADMRDRLCALDVYIDQFGTGSYGVAACEAMATGCVVVGNVVGRVRSRAREVAGVDLPVVQATIGQLPGVMSTLAGDLERVVQLSDAGPEFVNRVHSGELSASVLSRWLLER